MTAVSSSAVPPLHPELYSFSYEFLDPQLAKALQSDNKEELLALLDQQLFGVFTFKCLRPEFCRKFVEELDYLERHGVPHRRPNSMNRYGIVLDDVGFGHLMDELVAKVIRPLSSILFKHDGGETIAYHHAFSIKYKMGEDVKLSTHTDDAEITLNVCLGKEFEGGLLFFKGVQESSLVKIPSSLHSYQRTESIYEVGHQIGTGLIHLGRHVHGARPITSGERVNLIVWCKSTPYTKPPEVS